ncbi:helix-turn-helix domain-containing protein [Picosynechococcus sp. PCC 7117]|uniref:helix-turn-helix domain-containing protein n=1 Tax=Picosynechococcus sp. PCC 7117 TaxID=195498 RepID=UPI00081035B4|nr:helix-turn-helix domain-containing protein [Picosynechococcus sp. PCC 7117]ANV88155.1 transposase [Picosynechococcus sp. PCC 7117]
MGRRTKYKVCLSTEQRERLWAIARNGYQPAKKMLHARILLMADRAHPDGNWQDQQIAQALSVHPNTVARVRKLFVSDGETQALGRKPRAQPPIKPKLSDAKIAKLLALYHDGPPPGHDSWSLSLLVRELKAQKIVKHICRETVRKILKEQGIRLSRRKRA